jgi:ABC-type nitrate/sulfonate/bicarbonate transport system permease component
LRIHGTRHEAVVREDTRLALWRILLIVGGLGLVEVSVRLGWIDPFFLASPLQALAVLWSQIVAGNALYLTLVTLYEIGAALLIAPVV